MPTFVTFKSADDLHTEDSLFDTVCAEVGRAIRAGQPHPLQHTNAETQRANIRAEARRRFQRLRSTTTF